MKNNKENATTKGSYLRPEFENKGAQKKQFISLRDVSNFGRLLLWLFSSYDDKVQFFHMISAFHRIAKRSGTTFLVLYLKESHRLSMKTLAGEPEVCTTFPRVATRHGFPLIIPGTFRKRMFKKDIPVIQLILSLLTVYRVLRIPPILKINTITDLFTGQSEILPLFEVRNALRELKCLHGFSIAMDAYLIPSVTSAPNNRTSILGAPLDAWAFSEEPELLASFKAVADKTGPGLFKLLMQEIENLPILLASMTDEIRTKFKSNLKLGVLSEKIEAAGKVRVFAMTDIWTQSVLRPLHDALLRTLSRISSDGTFDQLAPIRRLYDIGCTEFWSFDLTAATDRIPVKLQTLILSNLVDDDFAQSWAKLLVSRPWYLRGVPYYYSVGQPMGALSSWGMMALTHHVMVLVAARRAGHTGYNRYALLGDDLVIADKSVADAYLVIAGDLGVEINISKSLISRDGVSEFAKRIFWYGKDLSPLPPRLISSLLRGVRFLPNVLRDMIGRGLTTQTFELLNRKEHKIPLLWEILGPFGFVRSSGLTPFLGDRSLTERQHRLICEAFARIVNKRCIRSFYELQNSSQDLIDKIGTLVWEGWRQVDDVPEKPGPSEKIVSYMSPELAGQAFGLPPKEGFDWKRDVMGQLKKIKLVKHCFTLNTPALHSVMDHLINLTIEKNTSPPEQLKVPKDVEFTHEFTYNFIQEGLKILDDVASAVPDISSLKKPAASNSSKMKFYRELEEELLTNGVDFATFAGTVARPQIEVLLADQ